MICINNIFLLIVILIYINYNLWFNYFMAHNIRSSRFAKLTFQIPSYCLGSQKILHYFWEEDLTLKHNL